MLSNSEEVDLALKSCSGGRYWPNAASHQRKLDALSHATTIRVVDFDLTFTKVTYNRWMMADTTKVDTIVWTWKAFENMLRTEKCSDTVLGDEHWIGQETISKSMPAVDRLLEALGGTSKKSIIISVPSATQVEIFMESVISYEEEARFASHRKEQRCYPREVFGYMHSQDYYDTPNSTDSPARMTQACTTLWMVLFAFVTMLAKHDGTANMQIHQSVALPFLITGRSPGVPIPVHIHEDALARSTNTARRFLSQAAVNTSMHFPTDVHLFGVESLLRPRPASPESDEAAALIESDPSEPTRSHARLMDQLKIFVDGGRVRITSHNESPDCAHHCRP